MFEITEDISINDNSIKNSEPKILYIYEELFEFMIDVIGWEIRNYDIVILRMKNGSEKTLKNRFGLFYK